MKALIKINILLVLIYAGLTQAFTYQGELTNQGSPFSGSIEMSFSLFDSSTMGNQIGNSDIQVVTVANGRFVVNLDQWMMFFDGSDLWLEIAVDLTGSNVTTLSPRQKLEAAPYAEFSYDGGGITSVIAGTGLLGGGPSGNVTLDVDTSAIQQRIGSSCPTGQAIRSVAADGTVTCQVTSGTGSNYSAGIGLTLTGTTFNVNVGSGNGLDSDLLDGKDSTDFMAATADSWVNTTGDAMTGALDIDNSDSSYMLLVVNSNATSGDGIRASNASPRTGDAAIYASNSSSGNAVLAISTSGVGVNGITNGTTGSPYGVYGNAVGNNGETSYGVRGESSSSLGTGVGGVAPFVGVFGSGTATTSENWGVYGKTLSTLGYGVYGIASNSAGHNYGVYGTSASADGYGVYGVNTDANGAGVRGESLNGHAVEGVVDSLNGGTGTGVYGSGGLTGTAAKFENAVTGTTAVTIQNIASPTAPALKVTGATNLEGPVTWKTVTSYVSVPAAAFTPRDDSYVYINSGDSLVPNNTNSAFYVAPVQLPHGAIVTKLTFYWSDTSFEGGNVILHQNNMGQSSLMASVVVPASTTSGGGGHYSADDTNIAHSTIDNSANSYFLYMYLPIDSSSHSIAANGVSIEYTINKPY